jgi:hypothetical protein
LGHILGVHSRVFMFKELHFFERLWTGRDRNRQLTYHGAVGLAARLLSIERDGILFQGDHRRLLVEGEEIVLAVLAKAPTAADVFREFLRYEAARHGKDIPCDQTPRNVYYVGDILDLYPEARIVLMIRDPRDVLASQKHKWRMRFKGLNRDPIYEALRLKINYHPVTTSLLWRAAVDSGDKWANHPQVHSVRFEDVIADSAMAVRQICDFIGIPFEPLMLNIPQVNSSYVGTSSIPSGIAGDATGRWRRGGLTRTEVYLCESVARRQMSRHGYAAAAAARPPRASVALSLVMMPIKALVALVLNLSKIKNMREAIGRRFGTSGG